MSDMLEKRIPRLLTELKELACVRTGEVEDIECAVRADPQGGGTPGPWRAFANDGDWGGAEQWWDFRCTVRPPQGYSGGQLLLQVSTGAGWHSTNPQLLVLVDGQIRQAVDGNHTAVLLGEGLSADARFDVYMKAYCQSAAGQRVPLSLRTVEQDARVMQLYYDICVPMEAAELLPEDSRARALALRAMSDALNCLDLRRPHSEEFSRSVEEAIACMQRGYYSALCGREPAPVAGCVGHTHIDVAYLWDIAQTRHKAVRSFATVIELMKRYPEYRFMSSQPVLYKFVKEDAPELYEQIRQRIAEGRWECEGGMWLEADCNIAGGESLVRQLLHGREFFLREFGRESRVLWLPDVFGYSAALPQLLRKSGIRYFMTTKLSWSDTNKFPYDTFTWKGMDGSEILTHMIPARNLLGDMQFMRGHNTTYNGDITPMQVAGGWNRFQQKGLDDNFLISYGFGDGGGGPTDKMLEYQRRMERQLPGMPAMQQTTSRRFFEELEQRVGGDRRLPKWSGELYLEFHRGTYTAVARNKRNNRKLEIALREAELWCTLAGCMGMTYPADELHAIWEQALTLQFHDILPGSCIRKVCDDADAAYADCFARVEALLDAAKDAIAAQAGGDIAVFNSLSYERDDVLWLDAPAGVTALRDVQGSEFPVQRTGRGCCAMVRGVPAMGVKPLWFVRGEADSSRLNVSAQGFATPHFEGEFDAAGRIASLIDRRAVRQVARQPLNRIVCYENKPHKYDAWEIGPYYTEHSWDVDDLRSVEVVENGPVLAVVRMEYAYQDSTVAQDVLLYRDLPRIDFDTSADWREKQYMLKAHFPVDVFYNSATYDVQFGNVSRPTHRNTSWDAARFETCHHKWMDVSEAGYGVSVLNDCKYGCSIDEQSMALTLFKSSTYPNPDADQCEHRFTYSLMPHAGDWRTGGTAQQAYALNMPLTARAASGAGRAMSVAAVDNSGVVIEAVKRQLDGEGAVVRMYECHGARTRFTLTTGIGAQRARLTDLMERPERELPMEGGRIGLEIKPYEILTVLLDK